MEGYDEWDEFVEKLARDLAPALKRHIYQSYLDRLRGLDTSSQKLVYLFLVLAQPQSYSTIRRGLRLPEKTLTRSLNRLKELNYIERDEEFLYWTT